MFAEHLRRDVVPASDLDYWTGRHRTDHHHHSPLLCRHNHHNPIHVRHLHKRGGQGRSVRTRVFFYIQSSIYPLQSLFWCNHNLGALYIKISLYTRRISAKLLYTLPIRHSLFVCQNWVVIHILRYYQSWGHDCASWHQVSVGMPTFTQTLLNSNAFIVDLLLLA